jgi:thiamine-monophosphate kinase
VTAATVREVGERALIARLRARLPAAPADVLIGVGDDAAVTEPPRGALEVLTTDTLVEHVHFDCRFCSPADVGHKALAVNLSDLAAMGARPRLALLSMGLPDSLALAAFDGAVDGLLDVAGRHGVTLIGGNLTRSPGPWFVDVTAVGTVARRRTLPRSGGRAGDELYVTGALGAARAGLAWLMQTTSSPEVAPHAAGVTPPPDGPLAEAVERYRRPEPRVRTGVLVGRNRAASACMDLSDGLADALTQVAEAGGLGVRLDLDAVPCHEAARLVWPADPQWQSLIGGDDYELLFAVPPRRRRAFLAAAQRKGLPPVTRIGTLTARRDGFRVRRADGSEVPLPRGYEHFS